MRPIAFPAALLTLAMLSPTARACLWDRDTLEMETARFPGVAELIAGQFPRHSPEYYEWRKGQCEALLAKDPKRAALYDDLAVAQHKLGDHQGAIATMFAKEKVAPGLYETFSNLGTFYIYTGELDKALEWIDKALAINSNAHFGREKYQRWLVEWVVAGKPMAPPGVESFSASSGPPVGFAGFIAKRIGASASSGSGWKEFRGPPLKGISGMMRFADFDNPLLLEALGDILDVGELDDNAARLAERAYVFALRKTADEEDHERIEMKLKMLHFTTPKSKKVGTVLDAALAEGAALAAKVRADEIEWIQAGKDVDAEFAKKYLGAVK